MASMYILLRSFSGNKDGDKEQQLEMDVETREVLFIFNRKY